MKAVLLAAGIGKRLGEKGQEIPKCLLNFGGQTLLERHLRALRKFGVRPVVVVVGYKKGLVQQELAAKFPDWRVACPFSGKLPAAVESPAPADPDILTVENPVFHHGNLLSLWATHKLIQTEPFILMDADVLCDERIVQRIVETPQANCFLIDRQFPEGNEEMHAAVKTGRVVRFERGLKARTFDVVGESVGFFKFSADGSRAMFAKLQEYIDRGDMDAHYDNALGDLLAHVEFGYEDITGLPWIEIDFDEDVRRAETEILPKLGKPAPPEGRGSLQHC